MIWVIIPAYNEELALPATLQSVFQQSGNYQVLVVDGGSIDNTHDIVNTDSRIIFLSAPKGRASQMNAGAQYAIKTYPSANNWLLFLHADTTLPNGALKKLNNMESDLSCQAGGFLHQFSGTDWRLYFISWLDNFRCRKTNIIYGDQALFVRQGLFEKLGGFPNQPILEDVAFCEKLVQCATPQLLTPPVVTDARKFIKMGIWRSLTRVLLIILHVEYGLPTLTKSFFQDIR